MDQSVPKKTRTILAALLFTAGGALAQFPAPYCGVTFQYNSDGNMITRVQFAGIDQTSPFTSGTTPSQENFLAVTGHVTRGQTYSISVKGPSGTFPSDVVLYVDWNQNQSFADAGEAYYIGRLGAANPANALTVTADIAVPANAVAGITRMRVLKNTNVPAYNDPGAPNSISGACATDLRAGQLEEYSLEVTAHTPQLPCTLGTPGPGAGDLGCLTFTYRGQPVYYGTVRAADGNVWLQQNLGSTQIAVAKDDSLAYGHMFQWGRWDDGHQLRNSTTGNVPAPNNPSGVGTGNSIFFTGTSSAAWWSPNALSDTWTGILPSDASATGGVDPCKAIGNGWSMPTEAQWTQVIADEGITSPDAAFAGHLKLTVGGSRSSSNGSFSFVGTRGYYWSSTTGSTGAKYLYYSSAITNPGAGSPRGGGASVRCISVPPVTVDSVTVALNAAPVIVGMGNTLTAQAVVYPVNANQAVTWTIVSETGTATVNNGTVTAQTPGTVWVKATSAADGTQADSVQITLIAECVPAVVINTDAGADICPGTAVVFTAQGTDTGTSPVYVWKKNNAIVGNNGTTYIEATPNDNDTFTCELTSDAVCNLSGTVHAASVTLQIHDTYQTPVSAEICGGATYTFFGTDLHATGTYTHTAASVYGCDSTITLTLTVKPAPEPHIGADGNLLTVAMFASYQWFLNGEPAPGNNTAQSYQAVQSGQYTVTVTGANGCVTTSPAYTHVANVGIAENHTGAFVVYPNPADHQITIRFNESPAEASLIILTSDGRTVRSVQLTQNAQEQTIALDGLPSGVYFIRLVLIDGFRQTVRIIKK